MLFGVVKFYGYKEYFLSNAYSNNQFFLILLQKLFQSIIQLNLPLYCAGRSERGVGRVVGWDGQTLVTSRQSSPLNPAQTYMQGPIKFLKSDKIMKENIQLFVF